MKKLLNKNNKFHFIGIGGYGMSALAKILLECGYVVSGSDIKESLIISKLRSFGANCYIGHNERNVADADVVVYSACIPADNVELAAAREKNTAVLHRAELLAELMNDRVGIAVTGAHGKTTTTTLIALFLKYLNFEPTVVIGAQVDNLEDGAMAGRGTFLVAEADESDGSFLFLKPTYSVITNLDLEHLDYYKDMIDIKKTYFQFMERTKGEGKIFYCNDNKPLRDIAKIYRKKMLSFGLSQESDMYASNLEFNGLVSEFDVFFRKRKLGRIKLNAAGEHNVVNCLGAIAVGCEIGIEFKKLKEAISFFYRAKRRCQIKADCNDVMLIDDYAHHPTEIRATLKSLKEIKKKRTIVVFQPHRYSRTKYLKDLFVNSLWDVDYVIITDIYSASEVPIEGINSKSLIDEIRLKGHNNAYFLPKKEITSHLLNIIEEGDLVVVLGAGDITNVADELSEKLRIRFKI